METTNEQDIISQLRNPSQRRAAFAKVVSQYSQPLYWQIRRMVTWHDDADDVLQNTFLKAWMGIENFRGEARLSTWLHRIAYNETLTFLSRQHETISLDTAYESIPEWDSVMQLRLTLEIGTEYNVEIPVDETGRRRRFGVKRAVTAFISAERDVKVVVHARFAILQLPVHDLSRDHRQHRPALHAHPVERRVARLGAEGVLVDRPARVGIDRGDVGDRTD